jgi:hypothetical protein
MIQKQKLELTWIEKEEKTRHHVHKQSLEK